MNGRFGTSSAIPLFLILFSCLIWVPSPRAAEVPVTVLVFGLEDEILQNVEAALALPPGLAELGELNLPWLERFERQIPEKVQAALEPFGYYNAQITTKSETGAAGKRIIMVTVVLGMPVRVTEVEVTVRGPGSQEAELRDLAADFPLKKGDVLRGDIYEKTKGAMKSQANDLGYLDAEFPVGRILVSRVASTARIELVLDTGPRYFFGAVSFTGADIYPEAFLRRHLAFKPGEAFSYTKLGLTQLNLINSDRFKEVIISPEKEEARDFVVSVGIRLEPALPKRLRFGLGYGTDTGARGTISYKDLNVRRRGHEFDSELNVSERLQGLAAGYRIPGRDVDSYTGLRLKLQREETVTFLSEVISLELSRTRGFGRGRIGTAYVSLLNEGSTVGEERANAKLILPGLRFSQQVYDNHVRPAKGFRYGLELRGTDRSFGSDISLMQVLGEGKIILPLPWRLSLITRAQGAITFASDDLTSLPASLRFFAGGDNSVRGFAYQSLGPKDEIGAVLGGRHLLVGSLEVERAILQNWGLAGFYDAGNAFNILKDITLAQGAGLGVRYYTPVGAIRFDLARQVGIEDPRFRIHFTLGFQL